jgi:acetyl esterase
MGVPAKQPVAKVTDIQIQGAAGPLAARVYDPQVAHGQAPVILYFHGGGWVTGDLDTYDASDRELANGTGAIVISVQYRLGPEYRFPAAQDDADASYAWLLQNAATIGADPKRIALAGESAGGNLAIDTAIWARDRHLPAPVHQLLVYPVVGTDTNTPSYKETVDAVPLNRKAILWYVAHFTNGPADLKDPRLNVVGAADLRALPPTTIVSAEIDPLRSEGEMLAQKLQAAGVPVAQRTFPGVTHEFFGMGAVVGEAKQAEDFATTRLKASFAQPTASAGPVSRHRATRPHMR